MTKVRTRVTRIAALLFFCISAVRLMAMAEGVVIDRIVATVNGQIILESDCDDALRYEALLSGRTVSDFNSEARRAVLDRLVDQELLGEQMKSALFKHATEEEAAAQVAHTRQLYPEAATDDGWKAVLGRYGLTEKALVAHVRQEIDLMRLVDAHLRPTVQIDSKSIEAYYRDQFIPQLKQSGSGDVPLEQVSGKIRELLTQEKVSELMVSWLQSLRAESKVSLPGAVDSSGQGVQTR
ncbi:MAG TPA: SurA N-terminal domain-containing protein [Candidatus Sulfotelmatobacter sp.]|nr:SurA N-terminal domain-containing protein [Candidatus Sulfotelmatobacter sp.]